MSTYDSIYVAEIMHTQGKVFDKIRDELPGVDEKVVHRKIYEK